MSTIKISELPDLIALSANNANTIFVAVDKTTGTTGHFGTTVLASSLFANNILNVGTATASILPGIVAQFISNTAPYSQINIQNINSKGSGDLVITADNGDNANNFIDFGIQGSNMDYDAAFNFANNDAYIYSHGKPGQVYGNLWIGTGTTGTDVVFFTGDTVKQKEIARFKDNTGLVLKNQIVFQDATTMNTAASPASYSTAAFAQANTGVVLAQAAFNSANIQSGVDTTQNTNITVATNLAQGAYTLSNTTSFIAQGAFNKANNALPNTSTTFGGTLTVTGDVIANSGNIGNLTLSNNAIYSSLTSADMTIGQAIATANLIINRTTNITKDLTITGNVVSNGTLIDFNNSTFNPNVAFVQITASANGATVAPSNTNYMLQVTGKANSVTRVVIDSFGQNSYPVVIGRMGRGSADLPTATQNNDVMMRIVGNGYTGTQFPASSPTKIDFVAAENFSDANRGTQIQFWNTKVGTNTLSQIATFNADSATFTGTVAPTKGFIYTPLVYPSAQTAITIDIANNSVVRAQTAAGLVVTLSSFVAGKVVEAWITNTAGTGQTFTHGCSAINSTINSTTYSIPSTSSIFVKYWCMDGTLANTFVAITK